MRKLCATASVATTAATETAACCSLSGSACYWGLGSCRGLSRLRRLSSPVVGVSAGSPSRTIAETLSLWSLGQGASRSRRVADNGG